MRVPVFALFVQIALLPLGPAGCSDPASPEGPPQWVERMIEEFKGAPVGNPPQSIWRYSYHGMTVYYVPPQCCDQFSQLYDGFGILLGAPDGGFSGGGDGRFPDFFSARTDEHLVWQDMRGRPVLFKTPDGN